MLSMASIIIRDIPDEVHRRFKLTCVANNGSMNNTLIQLMKVVVNKKYVPLNVDLDPEAP